MSDNDIRREEILARSRKAGIDEGVKDAELRGLRTGTTVASLFVAIPLALFAALTGQMSAVWAMLSVMNATLAVQGFFIYRFRRERRYLWTAVFWGGSAVVWIALLVATTLSG